MLTAKDIMTTEVVTVGPRTTVEELARILMEHHFSGAPVVDEAGVLVGIVTEHDLINKQKRLHIPTVVRILDAFIYLESSKKFEEDLKLMLAEKVGDICKTDVVTVGEDASVTEMATIMSEKGIHLLPVMRGGRMVGVVGKEDILRAMTQG
ncbi:MAG: CBS domain-containing protein [Nitrospirae bacterium]|nr:CBS domain-containing protein [Nitrospirota bacterium]MBI5694558.1 CBS domain-containing protein [Nitrospirota bacterium]